MTEVDKLFKRLRATGARIGGITLGDQRTTREEIARQINIALDEIESEKAEEITDFED